MPNPITLKIKFKSATLAHFIEKYSVDISQGGIFIRTKAPLAVGTQLKFEFQLSDGTPLIWGEGTVRWVRPFDPERTTTAPGMGVSFEKLAPQSQPVMEQVMAEKARRGEAQGESHFEAGARDQAAAVAPPEPDRDAKTPLPSPLPGLAHGPSDFSREDATRVMQPSQAEELLAATRAPGEPAKDEKAEPAEAKPAAAPVEAKPEVVPPPSGEAPAVESGKAPEPPPEIQAPDGEPASTAAGADAEKPAEKPVEKDDRPAEGDEKANAPIEPVSTPGADAAATPAETKAEPAAGDALAAGPTTAAAETKAEPAEVKPAEAPVEKKPEAAAEKKPEPAAETKIEPAPVTKPEPAKTEPEKGFPVVPVVVGVVVALAALAYFMLSGGDKPPPAPTPSPSAQVEAPPPPPPPVVKADAATPATAVNAADGGANADSVMVQVESTPVGASVSVDGQPTGLTTPALVPLAPGKTHKILFTLKGFKDKEKEKEVSKSSASAKTPSKVSVTLTETEKLVLVTSNPTGADVSIDDKKAGNRTGTEPVKVKVPTPLAKGHKLVVHKSGFVDETRTIDANTAFVVKDGKEVFEIAVTLTAKPPAPGDAAKDGDKDKAEKKDGAAKDEAKKADKPDKTEKSEKKDSTEKAADHAQEAK